MRSFVEVLGGTPAWFVNARCRGTNPELFFPDKRSGWAVTETVAQARRTCAECPVRIDCAAEGMSEVYGIWGGLSGRQRSQVRAELRPVQSISMLRKATPAAECGSLEGLDGHQIRGEAMCRPCAAVARGAKRAAAAADRRRLAVAVGALRPPTPGRWCGSARGAQIHKRAGEAPCGPCDEARLEARRAKRARAKARVSSPKGQEAC